MSNKNRANIVVRNIRPFYPISSESLNDQFDEVYYNITELLGYQNTSGVIQHDGIIRSDIESIRNELTEAFGYAASGYAESYVLSSGYMDALSQHANLTSHKLAGMIKNPW